jgi:Fe-S-cluster containining protein
LKTLLSNYLLAFPEGNPRPVPVHNTMNQPPKTLIRRTDLKPGEVLCSYCTARCCRYFALPIDTPETFEDFEYIRWFLLHKQASIFVDEDTWYLMVGSECKHLMDDHRCGIYHTRPKICREYSTDDCEYDNDATYEKFFELGSQMEEYANARFSTPDNFRTPKPVGLPVVYVSTKV